MIIAGGSDAVGVAGSAGVAGVAGVDAAAGAAGVVGAEGVGVAAGAGADAAGCGVVVRGVAGVDGVGAGRVGWDTMVGSGPGVDGGLGVAGDCAITLDDVSIATTLRAIPSVRPVIRIILNSSRLRD